MSMKFGTLALGLLCLSNEAHAYSYISAWGHPLVKADGHHTFEVNRTMHPEYANMAFDAGLAFNMNSSNAYVDVVMDDDFTTAVRNGESEIRFTRPTNFVMLCGPNAGACAINEYNANPSDPNTSNLLIQMISSDLIFPGAEMEGELVGRYNRTTDLRQLWGYNGAFRPSTNTFLHEMGHSFALGHEARLYSVMGRDWTHTTANGFTTQPSIGSDSARGLNLLYGAFNEGTMEDLEVSHWKYAGMASGAYSVHSRTDAFPVINAGTGLLGPGGGLDPAYNAVNDVPRGMQIVYETTVENNGAREHEVEVQWVMSPTQYIDDTDTVVGTTRIRIRPGNPLTVTSPPIPVPAEAGVTRFVGARVDPGNWIFENNNSNNDTWLYALRSY